MTLDELRLAHTPLRAGPSRERGTQLGGGEREKWELVGPFNPLERDLFMGTLKYSS
jgi:hypothetical protein